jgi:hypothetical protein
MRRVRIGVIGGHMNRRISNLKVLGVGIVVLLSMSAPALGTPCVSGTVADILGVTCTVGGNLSLSFQQWFASNFVLVDPGFRTDFPAVDAASVLFVPTATGFTLTAPDQSVSSSGTTAQVAQGVLSFSAFGQNGFGINLVLAEHTGVFQVAGNGFDARAFYGAGGGAGLSATQDTHQLTDTRGTVSGLNSTQIAQFPSGGSFFAEPYFVSAQGLLASAPPGGNASAAIAGPTTFTFNLVFVPEPSNLVLLVSGLAGLAGITWRARRASNFRLNSGG